MCASAYLTAEICLTLLLQVTSEPAFEHYVTLPKKEHNCGGALGAYVYLFLRTSGFCHADFLPCEKTVDFIRALGDRLVCS